MIAARFRAIVASPYGANMRWGSSLTFQEKNMGHRSKLRTALVAVLAFGALAATPVLASLPGTSQDDCQGGPRHDDRRGNPPPQHQPAPPPPQHRPPPPPPPQHRPPPPQASHRPAPLPPAYHFDDRHRGLAQSYYSREYSGRRGCPPGLTRSGRNCVPARSYTRSWSRGRPLPSSVIYYDLPPALVVELGPPPSGHRYVRVAGDILMIAVGTGLVVDALQDIFH
jgi:Ni/Co efflux regulator RcnB